MSKDSSDMAKKIVTLQKCKIEKPEEYKFFLEICLLATQGLKQTTQHIITGAEMFGDEFIRKFSPPEFINFLNLHMISLKFFEKFLLKELSPQAFNRKPDISLN